MKRSSFLKSLLGIAVAPKVLAEVDAAVVKDVPYKGKYAKSLLESTRFIDKEEILTKIIPRVGDVILGRADGEMYRVCSVSNFSGNWIASIRCVDRNIDSRNIDMHDYCTLFVPFELITYPA
jgi:hypothetical protein